MRLISLPICARLQWWTNYNMAAERIYISVWLHVRSYLGPLRNNINWKQNYNSESTRNLYHVHNKCTCKNGGGGLSIQPLSEDSVPLRETGREWLSVAWRGRPDNSAPTVILFSQWCMDVVRHQSPSRTSQYYYAEECNSRTMGDCDPCYGMTKLHQGGGEAYRRRFVLFNITRSAALQWHLNDWILSKIKISLQMLRKHILGLTVARNVVVSLVYWQYYDLFLKYNRPFQVWNLDRSRFDRSPTFIKTDSDFLR